MSIRYIIISSLLITCVSCNHWTLPSASCAPLDNVVKPGSHDGPCLHQWGNYIIAALFDIHHRERGSRVSKPNLILTTLSWLRAVTSYIGYPHFDAGLHAAVPQRVFTRTRPDKGHCYFLPNFLDWAGWKRFFAWSERSTKQALHSLRTYNICWLLAAKVKHLSAELPSYFCCRNAQPNSTRMPYCSLVRICGPSNTPMNMCSAK